MRKTVSASLCMCALIGNAGVAEEVTSVPLQLESGVHRISGFFNGERWELDPNTFSFLDAVDPELATILKQKFADGYKSCQYGSLQSTTPLTIEHRYYVVLSGTEGEQQADGRIVFKPTNSEEFCLPWDDNVHEKGEWRRERVCTSGPGVYQLPINENDFGVVSYNSSICGNWGSSDNCGSAGCGYNLQVGSFKDGTVGFEPYTSFAEGRWYLHTPHSQHSRALELYEIIDGELYPEPELNR